MSVATEAAAGESAFLDGAQAVRSETMAAGATVRGMFSGGDRLSATVSQPLRVAGGGLQLQLPTGIQVRAPGDFSFTHETVDVSLAPTGRQLDFALEYGLPLSDSAEFSVGGVMSRQPGHVREAATEYGAVASLRWSF
jgi:hypothetical protein